MPTLQEVVKQTGDLIAQNELWAELQPFWKAVDWAISKGDYGNGAELSPGDEPMIYVFTNLIDNPKAGKILIREFGGFIARRSGVRGHSIWDRKMAVPQPEHVQMFSEKLHDNDLRKKCKTYEQVIETYPDRGNSVPRLVAIHLANALIANNIPYPDSVGVNIMSWGPTADFANGKRYYSLVPLTSAYCPGPVHEFFGEALAELIVNDLTSVQDKSVAYALKGVMRNVIKRAEGHEE